MVKLYDLLVDEKVTKMIFILKKSHGKPNIFCFYLCWYFGIQHKKLPIMFIT